MSAEVFTQTGERLTKALITGDFDLYTRVMALGLEVVPQGGTPFRLETTEALRQDFDLFHQAIIQWSITDIYRKVLSVHALSDSEFAVRSEVNILIDARRVVDPFVTEMTLRQTPGGWKFHRIVSTLGHINWTIGKSRISESGQFT